jgi:hypothetical protein
MPENLHACTNRKDNCTLVDRAMEPLTAFKFTGRLDLRSVFSAADEVEISRIGNRRSGLDGCVFDGNAPPFETA